LFVRLQGGSAIVVTAIWVIHGPPFQKNLRELWPARNATLQMSEQECCCNLNNILLQAWRWDRNRMFLTRIVLQAWRWDRNRMFLTRMLLQMEQHSTPADHADEQCCCKWNNILLRPTMLDNNVVANGTTFYSGRPC